MSSSNQAVTMSNQAGEVAVPFTVTEQAAQQIEQKIAARGKGIGIRVTVRKTGCSGLAYELAFVDQVANQDHLFSLPGNRRLQVYIDPKAWLYLKGSTLDYVKRGLNEGFEFINPNEKGRCGCGESFTVS